MSEFIDEMTMAWEHVVPDAPTKLYRVLHYRGFKKRRMKCSDYYATQEAVNRALDRINADDLISVTTFDFAAVAAGKAEVAAEPDELSRLRDCVCRILDLAKGEKGWQAVQEMGIPHLADYLEEQDSRQEAFVDSLLHQKAAAEKELSVLHEQLQMIICGVTAAATLFAIKKSPAQAVANSYAAEIKQAILRAQQARIELLFRLEGESCQPDNPSSSPPEEPS